MANGKIKHVFPGGNTTRGFYSYYDYIISPTATRIFIIKGGPGVGKSTFMKKIGTKMADLGYDLEYHHCSSDNNSLDGLVISALQVAFIDGTAPHIVDPKNPGCVDEIIHLGDFWNEQKMIKNKAQILGCNQDVGSFFKRAYRILKAAKCVYDDLEAINYEAMNFAIANKKNFDISTAIFNNVTSTGAGKVRKLFASAITPEGPFNYITSIVGVMPKLYIIKGNPGTGKSTLLQKIADTAVMKGLNIEAYYCPLDPEKMEHLLISSLGIALTTSAPPHIYEPQSTETIIDMNECLNPAIIEKHAQEIAYNQQTFWALFNKAVFYLSQAKKLHDEMEKYYIPNMDFTAIAKIWDKTMDRVLAYTLTSSNS